MDDEKYADRFGPDPGSEIQSRLAARDLKFAKIEAIEQADAVARREILKGFEWPLGSGIRRSLSIPSQLNLLWSMFTGGPITLDAIDGSEPMTLTDVTTKAEVQKAAAAAIAAARADSTEAKSLIAVAATPDDVAEVAPVLIRTR